MWDGMRICLRIMGFFIPVNKKSIIFSSFGGRRFDDSPRALYDKICSMEEFRDWKLIWAFIEPEKIEIPRGEKVKIDTWPFFKALLSTYVWIGNSEIDRGIRLFSSKHIRIETWHGTPLKKICGEENQTSVEKVSKSRTTITNSLRLLKLHPQVQQMLIDQKISAGHARALLTVENPDVQVELAGRIFDERLNVRDIERIVRQLQKNEVPKPEKKPETEAMKLAYMQMEEKMKAVLGTKVTVNRRTEKKGRIEIEYYSREELERIFDLLKSLNG